MTDVVSIHHFKSKSQWFFETNSNKITNKLFVICLTKTFSRPFINLKKCNAELHKLCSVATTYIATVSLQKDVVYKIPY